MGVPEYTLRCELVYLHAVLTLVARNRVQESTDEVQARIGVVTGQLERLRGDDGPMEALAKRLGLDPVQIGFLWAAVAVSGDARIVTHAEALGGVLARRGLTPSLYADLFALEANHAHALTAWLGNSGNPLLRHGLLTVGDDTSTAASRPFAVPSRVLSHLRGENILDSSIHAIDSGNRLRFDDEQERALATLREMLRAPSTALVIVIEGPDGSGRRTVAAHAAARRLVVLDLTRIAPRQLDAGLLALRREAFLSDTLPVLDGADALPAETIADLGRAIDGWDTAVVVTSSRAGLDLGTRRPTMRVRWPIPGPALRRAHWAAFAGIDEEASAAELELLSQRYPVGPGTIVRAVASAQTAGSGQRLDADALATGLRHNIAERLGGLAHRVEVTQRWDDLVVADDTSDQLEALVARVRHAPRVLEQWGFKEKMARGTGAAALFSGPPGTGKSMCAGLIARELDLELYQVDLSQVVSKWVGETEKQLSRLFDAAEEGHALLLFDEADSLFGQRSSEIKGAVDRYANLEVNFLLQRIESFGGICILTTNLDTAIDRALKRRLVAHIIFDAPAEDERAALWKRLTSTTAAPLDPRIDLEEMARAYPKMTGANIRNAALAAAFFAAADQAPKITKDHLLRAARVEYRAMGHVLSDRGEGIARAGRITRSPKSSET